jgi:hypothetical protein
VGLADLPLLVTVTLTVPPVTITPDHVLLVLVLVTVLLLPSVNFQLENVLPLGPVAVHVAVPPRVTEDVQVNFATTTCWLGL